MVGLYKDPQGENVFSGNNPSKGSTDQLDKSDSASENIIATLNRRVIELETMLIQSQKQVCLSVMYSYVQLWNMSDIEREIKITRDWQIYSCSITDMYNQYSRSVSFVQFIVYLLT